MTIDYPDNSTFLCKMATEKGLNLNIHTDSYHSTTHI